MQTETETEEKEMVVDPSGQRRTVRQKTCAHCKKPYKKPTGGRNTTHCSVQCSALARHAKRKKTSK